MQESYNSINSIQELNGRYLEVDSGFRCDSAKKKFSDEAIEQLRTRRYGVFMLRALIKYLRSLLNM